MLRPDFRTLMLETLRPPRGYELDHAIGTTFTLDLIALLTAPLAFTFFDWEDEEGRPTADPLALVQAARRYASRVHLFCQAGRIDVPPHDKLLVTYLEESVFEVRGRHPNALFHPKVWLLRYRRPAAGQGSEHATGPGAGGGESVRYRLLCFTRNLTFARSWDTSLVLDGELTGRTNAFSRNHPLGDFIAALPGLALRDVPERIREAVELMQDEVRRVRFEAPEGFDEIGFWPLGIRDTPGPWPFAEPDRTRPFLVVSPFVDPRLLQRFERPLDLRYLISRPETLGALDAEALEPIEKVWALSPYADLEEQATDEEAHLLEADPEAEADPTGEPDASGNGTGDEAILSDDEEAELAGLHAKLYVMDDGYNARVWTGSANATNAAFRRNVEFLVELRGKKSRCGIKALLGGEEDGLRSLLLPHDPDSEPVEPDTEQRELEAELERLRARVVDLGLRVRVGEATETTEANATSDAEQQEEPGERAFELAVERESANKDPKAEGQARSIPEGTTIKTWPVTIRQEHSLTVPDLFSDTAQQDAVARFAPISLQAITAFFAFEIALEREDHSGRIRFVLRLPLEGAPEDRQERLLQSLLTDSDQVLRLLLFLLGEGDITVTEFVDVAHGDGASDRIFSMFRRSTLLEAMLRALERNPEALDEAAGLIADLEQTEDGRALLPDGLREIWDPIWECRQREREA